MTQYGSLRELEEAQDQESADARQRMEFAEECVAHYRSQMTRLQEDFAQLAQSEGFADAPGFCAELQAVADRVDENVWEAGRVIARFEEEDDDMRFQHERERDAFLEQRRE